MEQRMLLHCMLKIKNHNIYEGVGLCGSGLCDTLYSLSVFRNHISCGLCKCVLLRLRVCHVYKWFSQPLDIVDDV